MILRPTVASTLAWTLILTVNAKKPIPWGIGFFG